MNGPPSEFSLTEIAMMLGVSRYEIEYRADLGSLETFRPSGNPRGKRKVSLTTLKRMYPDAWESMVERIALTSQFGDNR